MALYKGNGPAGMAAWNVWRTGINNKIAKPARLKTCKKGYPQTAVPNPPVVRNFDELNAMAA